MWRSSQDWQYSTRDTKTCKAMEGGCYLPSGKTIGGTSSMNVMFAIRGSSHVYDLWEEKYNCNGWRYKDVLPYFIKSEGNTDPDLCSKYHCDKGPLKLSYYYEDPYKNFVTNTLNEAGYPTVRDINIQHGPCVCNVQGSIYNGRRFSVSKAYLNSIQCRSNFKLFKCATITRVLFKGRKAIGVEFYYKNKRYKAYARKEVILTAGSIGNSIILQQSGIGFQEDLDHNRITSWLPLPVGRYLQDHLACWQWFKSKGDTQPIGRLFSNIVGYYNCPRTLDFAGIGTISYIGFLNTTSNFLPHIECFFFRFDKQSINLLPLLAITQYTQKIKDAIIKANKNDVVILVAPTLLDPKSRGNVRIDGVNTPKPYIFFNYLDKYYDRISLIRAMQLVLSFTHTPTWKAAHVRLINLPICEQYTDITSDEYCNCYLEYMGGSIYHAIGTARMGKKPKNGEAATSVCNSKCQVHGTKHLTIADESL